jgi:DNA-binding NarL/FixJ family response regulator
MSTITVILADDHAVVRDGLGFLLDAQSEIKVVGHAPDGRSAVALAKELQPDVAVLDIAMPEMNGIEAAREIIAVSPATRVIILSMYSTSEHIFRSLEAGARGYVMKESAGAEVVSAVRAVAADQRYLSEKISERLIDDYVRQRRVTGASSPLSRLSPREREVLQLVVEGKSSAEIAATLFLSPATVDTYRSRLMHKLDIDDLPGLVKFAIQHGLTPLQ